MGRILKSKLFVRFFTLGICLVGFHTPAIAALYGDFSGDTVDFLSVRDSDGLYEAPTQFGDELLFFPSAFKSESENGIADTTSDTLLMTLEARPGNIIESIRFQEIGDYSLLGTAAGAQVDGMLVVSDIGGPNGTSYDSFQQSYALPDDGFGVFDEYWEIEFLYPTTKVMISLNNNLQASSTTGSTAMIQKKLGDAAVTLTVATVPIPSAILLFISGLGGGLWRLKKSRK